MTSPHIFLTEAYNKKNMFFGDVMNKIMLVFGTRPEAIKMCPLVNELKQRQDVETVVCVTGQHSQMLIGAMKAFDVIPDHDLSVMKEAQSLADITSNVICGMSDILDRERPNTVLVHGDTTTAFASAVSAFYKKIPVGHVEAGLRTYNIYSPYPEEFNRQAISIFAKYNFCPTEAAKDTLIKEGRAPERIYVTGNTAVDALKYTVRLDYTHSELEWARGSRLIVMTAHRRENIGEPMRRIFRAIRRVTEEYSDVKVIYPIHKNPAVRKIAEAELSDHNRIRMIEPLDVFDFHNFLARCYMVITDSGGIQEEAPYLGRPIIVTRDTTERPEGVSAGVVRLVGTDEQSVYDCCKLLLDDKCEYESMSRISAPYGDGYACKRIADVLCDE